MSWATPGCQIENAVAPSACPADEGALIACRWPVSSHWYAGAGGLSAWAAYQPVLALSGNVAEPDAAMYSPVERFQRPLYASFAASVCERTRVSPPDGAIRRTPFTVFVTNPPCVTPIASSTEKVMASCLPSGDQSTCE